MKNSSAVGISVLSEDSVCRWEDGISRDTRVKLRFGSQDEVRIRSRKSGPGLERRRGTTEQCCELDRVRARERI